MSVLFRNKEESKLKKLAVQTDSFERVILHMLFNILILNFIIFMWIICLKMVEEVFQHQEQMVRLAEHCLKYEEDDGKAGFHVKFILPHDFHILKSLFSISKN